jgi:hypothetical protein
VFSQKNLKEDLIFFTSYLVIDQIWK